MKRLYGKFASDVSRSLFSSVKWPYRKFILLGHAPKSYGIGVSHRLDKQSLQNATVSILVRQENKMTTEVKVYYWV